MNEYKNVGSLYSIFDPFNQPDFKWFVVTVFCIIWDVYKLNYNSIIWRDVFNYQFSV